MKDTLAQIIQQLAILAKSYGAELVHTSTFSSGREGEWTWHAKLELSIPEAAIESEVKDGVHRA